MVVEKKRGRYYTLRFRSKRDLPAGEEVWSSLRPPPSPRGRRRHTLEFFQTHKDQRVEVDITVPLLQQGKVNVKYYLKADKVSLLENGELILAEFVPDEWPPRK